MLLRYDYYRTGQRRKSARRWLIPLIAVVVLVLGGALVTLAR